MSAKKQTTALLQQLYDDYRLKLFNFCLARLSGERESADDCVQEAFLVLSTKLKNGEKIENPRAFLYRTAENFVKRRREQLAKDSKRLVPLDKASETASHDEILPETIENIDYDALAERLIETLRDDEKMLYNLRYIQNARVDKIASILNISRSAVSMRLVRLTTKITRAVNNIDFEKGG